MEHTQHTPVLASFGRRLLALVIDGIIVSLIATGLFFLIWGAHSMQYLQAISQAGRAGAPFWLSVILFVLFWGWSALFEGSKLQATPGKLICKIKVTNLGGHRISWRSAWGRGLAKIIANNNPLIPYILFFFTEKKQTAHDIIAKTLVAKK